MKRFFYLLAVLMCIISVNVFAQDMYDDDDDAPYLDEDDIAAIEIVLPEDIPEEIQDAPAVVEEKEPAGANEMSRLNAKGTLYHLLILDRTRCPNSDIGDLQNTKVQYKFKHGKNGYLIAIYTSSKDGPVFPVLPEGSRIMVDLVTSRDIVIKDYINSSAFRRFVTNRRILAEIKRIL